MAKLFRVFSVLSWLAIKPHREVSVLNAFLALKQCRLLCLSPLGFLLLRLSLEILGIDALRKWGRGDSNPHALRHMVLSHARLPIPTLPQIASSVLDNIPEKVNPGLSLCPLQILGWVCLRIAYLSLSMFKSSLLGIPLRRKRNRPHLFPVHLP